MENVYSIKHINTIIANAGTGTSFHVSNTTPLSSLMENFEINTLGPIMLYQTLYPLLTAKAKGEGVAGEGKFILISSSLGSIAAMEGAVPSLAYGISKAAANYFVRKMHFEERGVVAVAVHPGYVLIIFFFHSFSSDSPFKVLKSSPLSLSFLSSLLLSSLCV